jgi:hypothetical protein
VPVAADDLRRWLANWAAGKACYAIEVAVTAT